MASTPSSCDVDASPAPLWYNDLVTVQTKVMAKIRDFEMSGLAPLSEASPRAVLGGQAIRLMRRFIALKRKLNISSKQALPDMMTMLSLLSMCAWHQKALKVARTLLTMEDCDEDCFCRTAGSVVSLLRALQGEEAATAFFKAEVKQLGRCPYVDPLRMPTPVKSYASWLEPSPAFWNPLDFAAGRLLHRKRRALLRELRPFARRRVGLWRTHEPGGPYDQDPELVESGYWRQFSFFRGRGWNETVCAVLPNTCEILQSFNRTSDGERELGGKVKLYELGANSSLVPHYGPTNVRLLLHMFVLGSRASIHVGSEQREWTTPGQMIVFDDSLWHTVRNAGPWPRFVLSIQLNHPRVKATLRHDTGTYFFQQTK